MNLPCKTVIFGIDTPSLTPLQFRQMSGRAGRRGFDPAGTVIFMALPTNKIRRLLTASLATLRGNVPFTTAFLLRLISFVNGEGSKDRKILKGFKSSKLLDNADISDEEVRRKAALTLLKVPFVLQTHKGNFGNLLRYLTFFYVQLLRRMQLLDEKCIPRGFAHFALHLCQYDPGSLVFIHILQTGVLHRYIHTTYDDLHHEDNKTKAKEDIIFILAHIFTQKFVSLNVVDEQNLEKEPVLQHLPQMIETSINGYNKSVEELALASLQLGSTTKRLENPIIALSGVTDESLQLSRGQIDFASVFNSDLQLDEQFIPFIPINRFDHRGRKIYKNSYAIDFWKNPDADALVKYNRLNVAERWYLINDFCKLLNDISTGIQAIASKKDNIYKLIIGESERPEERLGIAEEYEDKFRKAFKMKKRFVEEGEPETSEKKENE